MGAKITVITLTLLILAASSNSTLNPSSSTISPSSSITEPSSSTISAPISTSSTIIPLITSTFTSKPSITTTSEFGFLSPKPSSHYEVTENVIDIPDDRTLPPIVSNFGLVKPLNVANTTVTVNKVIKNDTGDENNQLKRTSFTYVHITKDSEETKEGGIRKLFKGIKNYVYNLKKGVVDGLHNYFHRNDNNNNKGEYFNTNNNRNNDVKKNEDYKDFHHKFHRSFDSDETYDDFYDDHDHDHFKHDIKDLDD